MEKGFWHTRRPSGDARATDREITASAHDQGYIILTSDVDSPHILAHTAAYEPGATLLRGEPLVPELRGRSLLPALRNLDAELLTGAIATTDWGDKLRMRLLPIA